jgi:hypothetical protein
MSSDERANRKGYWRTIATYASVIDNDIYVPFVGDDCADNSLDCCVIGNIEREKFDL